MVGPRRAALVAFVLALYLAPPPLAAQAVGVPQSDVLVLDLDRLFEETRLGRRMRADHQAEREALAARNRKLEAELEAEEKRLTELRATTAPEEFRKMADAFDARVQEIRHDAERRARDLERDRERLTLEFLRKVQPVLANLLLAAGGDVILDARTVLFRTDDVDVTGLAIERIDLVLGDGRESDAPAQTPSPSGEN